MPDDRDPYAITSDEIEFLLDLLSDRREHGRAAQEGRNSD